MNKITQSENYKTSMYLIFTIGVFFAIVVRLSHGGMFGEVIVPGAIKFGEILIFLSAIMWVFKKLTDKQH